ncbi:MAG TPA: cobalamin-dependent protein [Elusimicrobiota bacterium]|nr:cobalamin-dependent protein [Elusimicrobiota bacterium]
MRTNLTTKKVLLTSVCRPFGESAGDAPSVGYELLHKQVTRAQGIFSPRVINSFFSLDYIAANLETPTVVLQYPSRAELIRELEKGYDYVGVSFIMAVFHKMKDTVELIRKHSPKTKIVLGGYGTILEDDLLKPYGDFVCRGEGVGFFRELLGETPLSMPYEHPIMLSTLKLFSIPISRTGQIFAGLGCPNGCDFCCTSHYFGRKHIRLLPTGKDIYDVIERYWKNDPQTVFMLFDEDFLLNKTRAMEFRDCVSKGGRVPSIFVFSSVKAISQYTVEQILEMGIDGIWVGYEGTRSGYAKQQGRPVADIFTEFREHGITILASMIVGFEYQNRDIIAEEHAGLMKLHPALSQFLIYGPVPGTPLYARMEKENRFRDCFKGQPEKYFRKADGFSVMVKHPAMTTDEVEGAQRWCFEQDYQQLGPSIFRVIEAWLLGYRKLKDSSNPLLRKKAAVYAQDLRKSYPIFLSGRCLGPNAAVRRGIGDLQRRVISELGRPTLGERGMSLVALAMACWTWFTLKFNLFQHPSLTRTTYRMPDNETALPSWEKIQSSLPVGDLQISVEKNPTR